MQVECSSVGECGIITENIAQGETTLAKKKPLKKDRKAGRGNLPAQKQPFYLQAQQQQRKPKPKKQREDWDEPAIEPGEYPVSCDRMDEQGSGVVYLEGEKLPVDGLLPGEQAVVEVFGKRNLHARLLQIKKASSKRVKPQCPAFAKCGGCKMQHLQYDSQLEWKQKTVEQLMKRYIDEGAKLYQIVGMVEPWRYRNKCHISFGMNGRRQIISGIYEENSHRVVPVESCLIQDSKADEIARSVRAIMKECKLLPYDEDSETGLLRHLLVRTGFASGQVMVVLVTASPIFPARSRFVSLLRERHPEITTIVMNCNPKKTSMVLGEQERILYGKGYIEDILCEKRFAISPRSFYQVNPQQTEVLYQRAIGMAQLKKGQRVLDAYCGIGTIGLIAADKVDEVIGVEVNAQAVKDANANAKRNGVENIRFVCADAGAFMTNLADAGEKIDVVFMDPPRSGSDEAFLQSVCRLSPDQVVYISCDPQTQKRDLAVLRAGGYHVREIQPVDMFPQTAHIETVVLLGRKKTTEDMVYAYVDYEPEDDTYLQGMKGNATYREIKEWIKAEYGMSVSSLYVAQIKDKCGFEKRQNYNIGENKAHVPNCPPEKEKAILKAFKHFRMI